MSLLDNIAHDIDELVSPIIGHGRVIEWQEPDIPNPPLIVVEQIQNATTEDTLDSSMREKFSTVGFEISCYVTDNYLYCTDGTDNTEEMLAQNGYFIPDQYKDHRRRYKRTELSCRLLADKIDAYMIHRGFVRRTSTSAGIYDGSKHRILSQYFGIAEKETKFIYQ